MMARKTPARIAELNDQFRKNPLDGHGRIVMTRNVHALGTDFALSALAAIAAFDTFTVDNNPYGERDFGIVIVNGTKLYWKIDCYNPAMTGGSEDPSDPAQTLRVMTIMLPEDY